MNILLVGGGTGGHLYPALAVARALVRADGGVQPFFVGARRGIEQHVLPGSEFPHVLLDLHPLYRPQLWRNWRTARGARSGWRALGAVWATRRPAVVVGTGGYAAALGMAYAVTHHTPVVQQVGDAIPGLTARLFSRWSVEMYLNFPEAARLLRARGPEALIDTGAPIEPPPSPRPNRAAARTRWGFPPNGGRVLLIHGGSQGALAVNQAVAEWIERGLPDDVYLIWSTGRGTYPRFRHLDGAAGGRVRATEYLAPISEAYAATDLALTRAGAMTIAELLAWGIPAILVPLPTAAANHQTLNAAALATAGAAVHVPQAELTVARLDRAVRDLVAHPDVLARLAATAAARGRPEAAQTIARRILTVAHLQQVHS